MAENDYNTLVRRANQAGRLPFLQATGLMQTPGELLQEITGGLKFNDQAWNDWLAAQPGGANIEDRRNEGWLMRALETKALHNWLTEQIQR